MVVPTHQFAHRCITRHSDGTGREVCSRRSSNLSKRSGRIGRYSDHALMATLLGRAAAQYRRIAQLSARLPLRAFFQLGAGGVVVQNGSAQVVAPSRSKLIQPQRAPA